MTPSQVITVDFKEIKEIQLACECGAVITLPLPLQNALEREFDCLACKRTLWAYNSPVLTRINGLINGLRHWQELEQSVLGLRFLLKQNSDVSSQKASPTTGV